MSDKFQNRYKVPSARLQNWDYDWDAAYFVTICAKDRECYFGDCVYGKMVLSNIGIIADLLWYEIKNHGQNIELGEFVVMPNHIHGIIVLDGNITQFDKSVIETTHALSLRSTTDGRLNQQINEFDKTIGQQRFQNQGKNTLSSIVGSYKSAVTKHARRLGFDFEWQTRFHDHIIRNDDAFRRISDYIINNSLEWEDDKFNNDNKG